MWLLIHTGIKAKHVSKSGPWYWWVITSRIHVINSSVALASLCRKRSRRCLSLIVWSFQVSDVWTCSGYFRKNLNYLIFHKISAQLCKLTTPDRSMEDRWSKLKRYNGSIYQSGGWLGLLAAISIICLSPTSYNYNKSISIFESSSSWIHVMFFLLVIPSTGITIEFLFKI